MGKTLIDHRPDHLEDELCFAIYTAQKNYNKFYSESLRPFKLTYSQYIVLLVLWEESRTMIIKELGTRLGLDTGTLTPLLRRMENDGWLTRERDTVDGRKVFISLTAKGRLMEEKVKDSVQSCFSHMAMNEAEYVENVVKLQAIADDLAQNNARISEMN